MLGKIHRHQALCCLQLSLFYCALHKVMTDDPAIRNKEMAEAFSRANKGFMLSLLKKFPSESNIFYSPFSISTALAMIHLGSGSQTLTEMKKALHFNEMDKDVYAAFNMYLEFLSKDIENNTLKTSNRIFLSMTSSAEESFLQNCIKHFNATLESMDFSKPETSTKSIDSWVSQQTEDNLHLHPINDRTLVLINAIYFKGNWNKKFKTRQTRKMNFWNGTANFMTEIMYQKDYFKFCHVSNLNFDLLELPFEGEFFSMLILLPTAKHNLEAVEKELTENILKNAIYNLRKQKVEVYLPKFRIESAFWLKSILSSLGMVSAFQNKADFSNMFKNTNVKMGVSLHRAFVNVDEEGTEAASITGVVATLISVQNTPKFQADRPFLFFICDTVNDVILFTGRFYCPVRVKGNSN
ncbi:serpin B8-like [Saccostrea cucullata]|uniref:serpin B8-like n=1 Tax=Saccostrea cuccullata TaxID=36930 RepID=UPI002ED1853F